VNKNLIDLTIILPTINECQNLKILIPEIVRKIDEATINKYEIIVVDDGSTDETDDLINNFNNSNKNIKLLKRQSEPSLPMSIYEGINKSNYEYVMWLDADGSMPATTIKDLISLQSENLDNVIIGSRFVKGGGYKGIQEIGKTSFFSALANVRQSKDSVSGMIASTLFNKLLIFILKSPIKDLTSGFIIGKRQYFLEESFSKSSYGEYFVYLMTDLMKKNVNIQELGYICETRIHGESKTASSLVQLFRRGVPYIKAAIISRRDK
jgi:glycosyltransferase involved in cell wall biosynthesis